MGFTALASFKRLSLSFVAFSSAFFSASSSILHNSKLFFSASRAQANSWEVRSSHPPLKSSAQSSLCRLNAKVMEPSITSSSLSDGSNIAATLDESDAPVLSPNRPNDIQAGVWCRGSGVGSLSSLCNTIGVSSTCATSGNRKCLNAATAASKDPSKTFPESSRTVTSTFSRQTHLPLWTHKASVSRALPSRTARSITRPIFVARSR
mmetsp:Transcript_12702/g.19148  ORF Transcript_12702/g.19148 Transcript_12702/m.19148 type:complete len:207 (+) Transcript_12702:756-1376(+)